MKSKFFACLLSMAILVVSCAQNTNNNAQKNALALPAIEFKAAIEKGGVQVLDVRTAAEFKGGHIQNALQANWMDKKEFADRTQYLDKKIPVYVYCQAGGRSAAAQAYLTEQGYTVTNLEGGMSNWKMQALPVIGASTKAQMRVEDLQKVIASNDLVLVDIGAEWCPPCRKMLPVLDALKKDKQHPFYFLAVDGGDDIDAMQFLKSQGLPTFIIFKKGIEVWRSQGITPIADFQKALK
jgi:rhodanese-related sulfurtransferase